MQYKKILLSLVIFSSIITTVSCEQTKSDHTITVFVHGTFPVRKILQYIPGGRSLIYCPQGLSLAKNLPKSYHFYKMAQGCVELNPQLYSFDTFYVFGWKSEHVYNTTRMQAAQDLIKELQILVENHYEQHHIIPEVKLIGFSHGGNVVLNTGNFLPLIVNHTKVAVDAWIFGTPVQQVNQNLVNSPHFNKIYAIYSKKDWLQRMDPQGLRDKKYRKNHFWSDRTFATNSSCIQVDFTVNGKPISHSYYRCIFKYLPKIQALVEKESQGLASGMIAVNLEI